MTLTILPFQAAQNSITWDTFCQDSAYPSILHQRLFLSYHRARFTDASLLIMGAKGLVGVFPAAVGDDGRTVVSHPGSTFGGVVHQGQLRGQAMLDALRAISVHYRERNFTNLVYKAVPHIYHRVPAQDDLYALSRLGACRTRCDLSSTIDLAHRGVVSTRRRRALKAAHKAQLKIVSDPQLLPAYWEILTLNLAERHGVTPVHSLTEIESLAARFPNDIRCICALHGNQLVAGIVLFSSPIVDHAQYIAATPAGLKSGGLDFVFDYAINSAHNQGKRWFDFGISTEKNGNYLNAGLNNFKSEFGAGGVVYESFKIDLNQCNEYSDY